MIVTGLHKAISLVPDFGFFPTSCGYDQVQTLPNFALA